MSANRFRTIPAVEKILSALGPQDLPRPTVLAVVRWEVAALRRGAAKDRLHEQEPATHATAGSVAATESTPRSPKGNRAREQVATDFTTIINRVREQLDRLRAARLQPVINGTGVLIHTNLGRAPLGAGVIETLTAIAAQYNNLEFDLADGERGTRGSYVEHNLSLLCGAEAATIVNNCAAALVLILRHFTAGERKEVLISRGELVQIGGGFRIPEILETSGARLREVGTTNKTTLDDYARALSPNTALMLKVHRSNFFMGGFVESPTTEALANLARQRRLPFVEDLGSGAVVDTATYGLGEREPTPAEVLRRGVHLVCFSGDKLLGGPQSGIIAGQAKLVRALKRNPFFRALRCDKLILAALQTTVDCYLASEGTRPTDLPLLALLYVSTDTLRGRAEELAAGLSGLPFEVKVGTGRARVGGGTLPRVSLASVTLDLVPREMTLAQIATRLRAATPPVLGYLSGGRFKLDLRTIFPAQDEALAKALREAGLSIQNRPPSEQG